MSLKSEDSKKTLVRKVMIAMVIVGDAEIDQLRRRLEETERAMERIVAQMGRMPGPEPKVTANLDDAP